MNLFPELKYGDTTFADLWRSWFLTEEFKSDAEVFDEWLLTDGERWDTVAERVFGDRELWWTLPFFNEIEDPFSIYFQKDLSISLKTIKVPNEENVRRMLLEIRRRRIAFDK